MVMIDMPPSNATGLVCAANTALFRLQVVPVWAKTHPSACQRNSSECYSFSVFLIVLIYFSQAFYAKFFFSFFGAGRTNSASISFCIPDKWLEAVVAYLLCWYEFFWIPVSISVIMTALAVSSFLVLPIKPAANAFSYTVSAAWASADIRLFDYEI